jgi:glycosyltransferase involved in cell wall biosynthesis
MLLGRSLFISSHYPSEPLELSVHGVFQRMGLFISALAQTFNKVELLFYAPPDTDCSSEQRCRREAEFRRAWGSNLELTLVPRSPITYRSGFSYYFMPMWTLWAQRSYASMVGTQQVRACEVALGRRPELVFVHRLYGLPPVMRAKTWIPPLVVDLDEIEYRWFRRSIADPPFWPLKRLQYLQLPAFYIAEKNALRRADRVFVSSTIDRDFLVRRWHLSSARLIPNATAIPLKAPPIAQEPTLLLLGNYGYGPNVVAADRLIRHIWPRIRRRRPDAQLIIAGDLPENIPSRSDAPAGVEFTGFVPDLAALYARTRVVVCPIYSGGGTRLKIIEAAAYGRAIVSTSMGTEGLVFEPERDLLVHDDEPGFADACIALLANVTFAERLGSSARTIAFREYDIGAVSTKVREELLTLLE